MTAGKDQQFRNVAQFGRAAGLPVPLQAQVQILPFRRALWLSKHPTYLDALQKKERKTAGAALP